MAAIALCLVLVAIGVVMVVLWGGKAEAAAPAPLLRYAWVALAAGLAAGLIAAGAGGRLVMRLLALTSPDVQGVTTEAGETVGEISLDGTLGFVIFSGLAAGVVSAVLYALLRPVLPAGRLGGLCLGALLLILAGTRIEPLRSDNFDFTVLGPAWLAVLAFTCVGLFQGMLVTAIGARLSGQAAPVPPAAIRQRTYRLGRIAVGVLALVALPGFVGAVTDIL